MYLDISSMRKPSMEQRQHWVMLVDEATKYKKSFFLKKMTEFHQPLQVKSHLEMPGILVQLGHIQCT